MDMELDDRQGPERLDNRMQADHDQEDLKGLMRRWNNYTIETDIHNSIALNEPVAQGDEWPFVYMPQLPELELIFGKQGELHMVACSMESFLGFLMWTFFPGLYECVCNKWHCCQRIMFSGTFTTDSDSVQMNCLNLDRFTVQREGAASIKTHGAALFGAGDHALGLPISR